jgi:hypothetical protein
MVEIDEFRQFVHAHPCDGFVEGVALAHREQLGAVRADPAVAIHTDLRRRNRREGRSLDGEIAIAAIHAHVAGVQLVAELHRLDGCIADFEVLIWCRSSRGQFPKGPAPPADRAPNTGAPDLPTLEIESAACKLSTRITAYPVKGDGAAAHGYPSRPSASCPDARLFYRRCFPPSAEHRMLIRCLCVGNDASVPVAARGVQSRICRRGGRPASRSASDPPSAPELVQASPVPRQVPGVPQGADLSTPMCQPRARRRCTSTTRPSDGGGSLHPGSTDGARAPPGDPGAAPISSGTAGVIRQVGLRQATSTTATTVDS